MGVALHKPAGNNGRGFMHTYTLMNGRGCHMSTDCNLRKWALLTKEAELRYDGTFNLARGVRLE